MSYYEMDMRSAGASDRQTETDLLVDTVPDVPIRPRFPTGPFFAIVLCVALLAFVLVVYLNALGPYVRLRHGTGQTISPSQVWWALLQLPTTTRSFSMYTARPMEEGQS